MKHVARVLAMGVVLAAAGAAGAAIVAQDSFEAYVLGDLKGQGSAAGGWGGPWDGENDGGQVIDVSGDPLSAAGLTGGDQALELSNREWRAADRDLASSLSDEDGYYISYLIRITTGGFQAWLYNPANNRDHHFFGLDADDAGDVIASPKLGAGNNARGFGDLGASGDFLVVGKILDDSIRVWLNPTAESDPSIVSTDSPGWPDLGGIAFMQNKGGDDVIVDRVVIGESFGDVAVPEPASAALVAAGLAALAAVGRRRRSRRD